MKNFRKVIIIGAGPAGLYFATLCEKSNLDYLLIEATDAVGGQITHLYPKKEIVDIPGIESIISEDYVSLLRSKIKEENLILNERVLNIENGEKIKISSQNHEYFCEKLVVATGLGTSTPRPLGVENESQCKNIIYNINDYSYLKNKKVAIFGGGDSALDWAKHISSISDNVHLVHRRMEFRGNPDTIKDCKTLNVHLPFVPERINVKDNLATSVFIKNVNNAEEIIEIPVDYIFVNYGNIAMQSDFNFEKDGSFFKVDENLKTQNNIFCIGDVCSYENKKRRIAPLIEEANKVFQQIIC